MRFSGTRRIVPLTAAALVSIASAAPAAEVELADGRTCQADQVVFEGQTGRFTFRSGNVKSTFLASQVRYVRSDESNLTSLTAQAQALERENEELRKAKAGAGPGAAPASESIQQFYDKIYALTRERDQSRAAETLAKRKAEDLAAKNADYLAEIERLKAAARASVPTSVPLSAQGGEGKALPPKPRIESFQKSPSTVPGLVEIKGVAWNNTGRAFSQALIEISAYDTGGRLLATSRTFIPDFAPDERRPFRADLEADYPRVARVAVSAGAVFFP